MGPSNKQGVCRHLWQHLVLCVISAQFQLVTHLCVKFIPNLEGVVRSRDLAYALAIPWHWASLACSTAFIFEPTLIRLLIWFSLSWQLPNQLCRLPFLILRKLSHPHPFETFHPSANYSNFEANVIRPAIRAVRSWAELSQALDPGRPVFSVPHPSLEETLQFLLETDYNHLGHQLHLPPPLSTPKLSVTIPLTHTMSVVGHISNKCPDCYVWQSGFFEAGSHVVLGMTYRKVKIVGPYRVGRNYIMMKLEEVGRVPEDRIAIQRMVVLKCPSSHFYQLSFHQCLFWFFLNQFLGTFRDFTDDDDDDSFERDIKSVESSDRSSDSSSSNSELFDEVEFSSEEMCENGSPECSMDEEDSVSC